MDIEERESQELVTNILVELCDQVLEYCHRNVCTKNNGHKAFTEIEITKCVQETLSYIVEQCSLDQNQELTVNTENSKLKTNWNIFTDEDREKEYFVSKLYQSAKESQVEKAQNTSSESNMYHVAGLEEGDVPIHSEQNVPNITVACGIDEVFAHDSLCAEDDFALDTGDTSSKNSLQWDIEENCFDLKEGIKNIEENCFDLKEGIKKAKLDEQVAMHHVTDTDMDSVDLTHVPALEDCAIKLYQEAKIHKLDQTNEHFEVQVTTKHQKHLDEEQEGKSRDKTTGTKWKLQGYYVGDTTALKTQTADGRVSQCPSDKDYQHISQQGLEKTQTLQDTMLERSLVYSVEHSQLPKQNEVDNQKCERALGQAVDQPPQQNAVTDHLCKQHVSQDEPFKHIVQNQVFEQSAERGKDMTSHDEQFMDQSSQQKLLEDQTCEKSVEHNKIRQELPSLSWTFEQSVEIDQAKPEENVVPDWKDELSHDKDKTFEFDETLDQTFQGSVERKDTFILNGKIDQACVQFVKHDQTCRQVKEHVIDQVFKQCDVKDQLSQQIVHSQKSVLSIENDQIHQELVLPEQAHDHSFEKHPPSLQIDTLDQNISPVEQDLTSQQNVVQDQLSENCVAQSQPSKEHVLGLAFEHVVEPHKDKTLTPEQVVQRDQKSMSDQMLTPEQIVQQDQMLTPEQIVQQDQKSKPDQTLTPEQIVQQDQMLTLEQIVQQDQTLQPDQVLTPEQIVHQDQISQPDQMLTPEQIVQQDQMLTPEQIVQQYQISLPDQVLTPPEQIIEQDQILTPEQIVQQDQTSQPDQILTPDQVIQHDQTSRTDWNSSPEQIDRQDQTLTPIELDQASQEISAPAQPSYKNEVFDQIYRQSVDQNQTENVVNDQTFKEHSAVNKISKKMFVQASTVKDHTTIENALVQTVEKTTMQSPMFESTVLQDQQSPPSIVLKQNSDKSALQVGSKYESFKDQTFDGVMQELVTQKSVLLENKIKTTNLHNDLAEKTTFKKVTFDKFDEEKTVCEQTNEVQNLKEQNISDSDTKSFRHFDSCEEQFCQQHPIINRTLNGECDSDNILTERMMKGSELFTSHEKSKDKHFQLSLTGATDQRMNSQDQQLPYCSEESPSCRPKRNFVAEEDTKFTKEEPDMKRMCIDLQSSSSMDDQAVPSVETADHFLPQEETCIYNCYGASKPFKKETFGANEICTNDSVLDHEHSEKPMIQNGNEADCDLLDQELPSQKSGAFKWKYAPSFETDAVAPKKDEQDGCVQLIRVVSLPICRKPRRLGLSKKQKIQHLHPKFHP